MTVTIDLYASLRDDADAIADKLTDVSRAEALQALLAAARIADRNELVDFVLEGIDGALFELDRVIARALDDLAVLRRVVDHARALHGIGQPAAAAG